MINIGYCCINLGINEGLRKKDQISVNRGMVRKTFDSKGLPYVSELVILNLKDTLKILDWNISKGISVYRMSSDSFPWMSEYEFEHLPNFGVISKLLESIGNKVKSNSLRVSYHPGPYSVLASENEFVVRKSVIDLERHAHLMDLMGLDRSDFYPINTHINTTKPDCRTASERFCKNFELLSESLRSRLTLENDDSPNQYSVKMIHEWVHSKIKIPIVFDQHHFIYGPQDQTMEEALNLAVSTWKTRPLTHMSSSRRIEDEKSIVTAHADYIYEKVETFGISFDCELEAKSKDLAVLKYRKDFM